MKVPSLGGSEQQVAFDVDSPPTFSPDGTRICFYRGVPQEGRDVLVVRDLAKGEEEIFASVESPLGFANAAAWSPDGSRIAALIRTTGAESGTIITTYDVDDGDREDVLVRAGVFLNDMAWLSDGSALVVSGFDATSSLSQQIFLVTYPKGEWRRVTNDMNTYWGVTVSAGDEAIAATRGNRLENLFVVDIETGQSRQITSITNPEHSPWFVDVTPEGDVVFSAARGDNTRLYHLDPASGDTRRIPTGAGMVTAVDASARGVIPFVRFDGEAGGHIFRVNADGSELRQLTSGSGERLFDGTDTGLVAFSYVDSTNGVWVVPTGGGEPRLISARANTSFGLFSPDGSRLVTIEFEKRADDLIREVYRISSTTDGETIAVVRPPQQYQGVAFAANNDWLSFVDRADPARNLYRLRIGEDTPQQVTRFTEGRMLRYRWSADGSQLVMERRIDGRESVWVCDADGGNARLVVAPPGEVFRIRWFPDGDRLLVSWGTSSNDAILVRNFR
jgi:Tol biopolymer transport system component